MDKSLVLSLAIAITGIIVLEAVPKTSYDHKTIEEIQSNCEGKVKTTGRVIKSFKSDKGNYIGILSGEEEEVLVMFPEENIFPGDEVQIKGRASEYKEQCFLFPDEVKLKH